MIFKYDFSSLAWDSKFLFTFQSGDIQILRAIDFAFSTPIFTFQSGDIQIPYSSFIFAHIFIFTFQSGDIQICYVSKDGYTFTLIYIPIWWYSNLLSYILFRILRLCIYIPIWWYSNKIFIFYVSICLKYLHSNLVIFKFFITSRQVFVLFVIYIPIWWYSNDISLIKCYTNSSNLHSNLVILLQRYAIIIIYHFYY